MVSCDLIHTFAIDFIGLLTHSFDWIPLLSDSMDLDGMETNGHEFCADLMKRLKKSELPVSCLQHLERQPSLSIRRQNSRHDNAIAFIGLPPGEAEAAMSARDRGMVQHAKLQRRMTGGLTGRYHRD